MFLLCPMMLCGPQISNSMSKAISESALLDPSQSATPDSQAAPLNVVKTLRHQRNLDTILPCRRPPLSTLHSLPPKSIPSRHNVCSHQTSDRNGAARYVSLRSPARQRDHRKLMKPLSPTDRRPPTLPRRQRRLHLLFLTKGRRARHTEARPCLRRARHTALDESDHRQAAPGSAAAQPGGQARSHAIRAVRSRNTISDQQTREKQSKKD